MKIEDPHQVAAWLAEGVPCAEVLPPAHWEDGHLPGAANLPLEGLEARAAALFPDKTRTLVLYCSNERCRNSHEAAARLERVGYSAVHVFVGGKAAWKAAGLPLERAR